MSIDVLIVWGFNFLVWLVIFIEEFCNGKFKVAFRWFLLPVGVLGCYLIIETTGSWILTMIAGWVTIKFCDLDS